MRGILLDAEELKPSSSKENLHPFQPEPFYAVPGGREPRRSPAQPPVIPVTPVTRAPSTSDFQLLRSLLSPLHIPSPHPLSNSHIYSSKQLLRCFCKQRAQTSKALPLCQSLARHWDGRRAARRTTQVFGNGGEQLQWWQLGAQPWLSPCRHPCMSQQGASAAGAQLCSESCRAPGLWAAG